MARAESLRADLAGIAARIGGITGSGPNVAPAVEAVPSDLIERLDRLAVMAGPGFATIEELRRSWDGIIDDLTAWRAARNEEFARAMEGAAVRFDSMAADVDQRHQRHLAEFAEQSEGRLAGLANAIDRVNTRLDRLTEMAQPVPGALERIRQGQGRLGAESAEAILAVTALDERLRHGSDESTDEVVRRLDQLGSLAVPGFEAMGEFRRSLDERLARMESAAGSGIESVSDLRRSWDGMMAQATTSNSERGGELDRAVEAVATRFEVILADLDHRNQHQLSTLTEQGEGRMSDWTSALGVIGSRLDDLTETTQQLPEQLARLHHEHARLARESTAAVVDGLDQRIRNSQAESTSELVTRLDMLASMAPVGVQAIDEFRQAWDGTVEQMTTSTVARERALAQAVEAASDRVEAMIAGLDQRHQRRLQEADEHGDLRLAAALDAIGSRLDRLTEIAQPVAGELEHLRREQHGVEAQSTAAVIDALDERLRLFREESTFEILEHLDRLTVAPETVAELHESIARLRREQDRLAANIDSAVARLADTVHDLKEQPETGSAEVIDNMSRVGAELEGASARLRETSEQLAQEGQDRRGQMATLDLGLRVALTGMEAVVSGRQGEQLAQIKDAQSEVVQSVIDALSGFGHRVDAGLQHATEELTTSVFLTHEDSDERSHALQNDLTRVLARVEDAELERDERLVDLRRVVDRLTREVQLIRPAIDLRGGPDDTFNEVALDRFANRVAAILSQEVVARLDGSTQAAIGPTAFRSPPA